MTPLTLSLSLSPSPSLSLSLLQTRTSSFSSHPSPFKIKPSTLLVFAKKEPSLIDDVEGYLHNLEYDSVWDTKPSWCQPWSISLTGVSVIAISWFILKSLLLTSFISLLIGAWWYIFLYSYPKAYSEMIADRRQKVRNGEEDTFGVTNNH
ncbi:hypothetical protein Lal_00032958 [Lupinus albus]|uniref:Uncharacterized protein n=1 Tax=Lupinus albus TaxID=3870 RepID=A0A6A5PLH8_LUPAL|nr:hypothetical protein Lalb_Chr01g0020121 [Lupinus albus]KAF1898193.1 hypothetical protein Lal_00032958 [Lupinus albus]